MPSRSRVAGHPQRAVADQAGAQQRRRLEVRVAVGQREAEALVGHRVLGVAAVAVVAGEACAVAEVLPARAAVAAVAVGPAQPGTPRRGRRREALAAAHHAPDDLVAEHQRQLGSVELAVDDVQVGAAHAAGGHLEQHLPGPARSVGQVAAAARSGRRRRGAIARTQRSARPSSTRSAAADPGQQRPGGRSAYSGASPPAPRAPARAAPRPTPGRPAAPPQTPARDQSSS